ncbi:MAG: hypothetical protein KAG61_01615 [Bacteriovoracaceae bacterium]|nr:hypothetical protein [Bacteriovoracaceae bacterium]
MKKLATILIILFATHSIAAEKCYQFDAPKSMKKANFKWISTPILSGKSKETTLVVKSGRALFAGTFYCMSSRPKAYQCVGDDDSGDFTITGGKDNPIIVIKHLTVGVPDRANVQIMTKTPLTIQGKIANCK